jgi:hypothetical protein
MRWISQLRFLTVVVHTTTAQSIRGVLTRTYKDCLVLDHAEFLAGDTTTTIDGEVIVPRERVAWIQTLRAKEYE